MSIKSYIQARSTFDISDPKIDTLIDISSTRLSSIGFDTSKTYEYAVALLVMHWLSLSKQSSISNNMGSAGGLKSITEGRLSISFGSISGTQSDMLADLQQTSYGVELASLMETAVIAPVCRFG